MEGSSGPLEKAIRLLDEMSWDAPAGGRFGSLIKILVVQARAHACYSRCDAALAALDEVVYLGQPEGYQQVFVEEIRGSANFLAKVWSRASRASQG